MISTILKNCNKKREAKASLSEFYIKSIYFLMNFVELVFSPFASVWMK